MGRDNNSTPKDFKKPTEKAPPSTGLDGPMESVPTLPYDSGAVLPLSVPPNLRVELGGSMLEDLSPKQIRKTLHQDEWWFSIIDVVEVLVGGDRPRKYWNDLKTKLTEEGYDELSEKIGQLKLPSRDGKYYFTDCANTETLFRINRAGCPMLEELPILGNVKTQTSSL